MHISFKGSTMVQWLRRSMALRAVQKFNNGSMPSAFNGTGSKVQQLFLTCAIFYYFQI